MWLSQMYMYILSLPLQPHPPLQVITGLWAELPVLYGSFLLAIYQYFTHGNLKVYFFSFSFFFLFYWSIVDGEYYISYRFTMLWVTNFKGYSPFICGLQSMGPQKVIYNWVTQDSHKHAIYRYKILTVPHIVKYMWFKIYCGLFYT